MKRSIGHDSLPPFWARLRRSGPAGWEAGQSLVETAFLLTLLLPLLVGIILGGIMFYDYVTLADAVEAGARELVTNQTNNQACYMAGQTITSAAANLNTNQITVTFSPGIASGTYVEGNPSKITACTLTEGSYASVTATYPCSMTIPFTKINVCPVQNGSSSFISSTTTMRIE
jgi:Flp pilus assembly protein TadG